MAKNIVLCSDGTGNSGGKGNGTNVWRIFNSIDLNSFREGRSATEQVAFYDDGVGTERGRILRAIAGGVGFGLSRNVRQLYIDLVRNYEPGDHIYLFGFSRGAFTVRTLAGLIAEGGILDNSRFEDERQLKNAVWDLYRAYRYKYRALLSPLMYGVGNLLGIQNPGDIETIRSRAGVQVEASMYSDYTRVSEPFEPGRHVPIRFIGVWDTVDAVGLPFDELADWINTVLFRFSFNSGILHPWVDKACHAISIDDDRRTFAPVMFDQSAESAQDRIEQIWFPGVHANVGGGLAKQGMAHISLNWMIRKAQAQGLVFDEDSLATFRQAANEQDELPDARSGAGIYYRYGPRDLAETCGTNGVDPVRIHVSTFRRIAFGTDKYAPGNIPTAFKIEVDSPSNIGESDADQTLVSEAVANGLSRDPERYKQASLVAKRRLLHRWLWLATLAILGYGAVLRGSTDAEPQVQGLLLGLMNLVEYLSGLIPVIGGYLFEQFIKPLFLFPQVGLIVLAGPLVLAFVDYLIKRRMGTARQKIWRASLRGPWW